MLHIEAMTPPLNAPSVAHLKTNVDAVSQLQQEADASSNQSVNVAQKDQACTSIGNSTQYSRAWNWNKKSFLSRLVSWIKGDVGFVAYNNKVVVLNTSDDVQKLNNPNGSFEVTDVSFFKRLKAVVWGDELKEVERDFERAKMNAYLSDFFVSFENFSKNEKDTNNFDTNKFISNFCNQIWDKEKQMKSRFKETSIDINAELEFKSKFLDHLLSLNRNKAQSFILRRKDFFDKFNTDFLKNLLSLRSRLELYKQATQGHLYQAKMPQPSGRISYILVDDEKQLKDFQRKNDDTITIQKVPGEKLSLDKEFRFKVEVDDDLTGGTKSIEVPKVMDFIEFQDRVKVYKQATQGHLYRATMANGDFRYILVDKEKQLQQLQDWQFKNDRKRAFRKVSEDDKKLRYGVAMQPDLYQAKIDGRISYIYFDDEQQLKDYYRGIKFLKVSETHTTLRWEVYKQMHLYQANIDGRSSYIYVYDEQQLKDYYRGIGFRKVSEKNVSLEENLHLKVKVDDRTGGTKSIDVPKVMDFIEFQDKIQKNENLSEESIIDSLKDEPIWDYLKIDSSTVPVLKNWVTANLDEKDKLEFQELLKHVIRGTGSLSTKVEFFENRHDDIDRKFCLGSMLLYNDEPIYKEQNRKLFQLMLKNEALYDFINVQVEQFIALCLLLGFDSYDEKKTILWKMFTAQWRRDFLEGRATISRQ